MQPELSRSNDEMRVRDEGGNPMAINLAALLQPGCAEAAFHTHYQPIVDLREAKILGYEALTRGPSDSPFHSPLVLFDVAAQCGLLVELERQLIRLIIARFNRAKLPGKLFINVTIDTLVTYEQEVPVIRQELSRVEIEPARLVVEVSEIRSAIDSHTLHSAVNALKALGIVFALDDLGEGFSGLRRWSELRPDFVKIDRHFIDGISEDPVKFEFVRSIVTLASQLGTAVVAEGLESEADLHTLRAAGVGMVQGYLFARPTAQPRSLLSLDANNLLSRGAVNSPTLDAGASQATAAPLALTCAGDLSRRATTTTADTRCEEIVGIFLNNADMFSIVVLDGNEVPVGLLRRLDILSRASGRYFMDINRNKPCGILMDANALCFESSAPLSAMAERVANMREAHLMDGYIVTRQGKYVGSGRVNDLLKAVNQLQLQTARNSNPLTHLPGNAPIQFQMDASLSGTEPFHVAYFDLDHFKPFNDVYGYKLGDEVILICAQAIRQHLDATVDFLGHVGGDDFVSIVRSPDWEARVRQILASFEREVRHLFNPEHLAAGGYKSPDRTGGEIFHPLTTLSVGVVYAPPGRYRQHAELATVAAQAKREAKKIPGNSYFVERRLPGHGLRTPSASVSVQQGDTA